MARRRLLRATGLTTALLLLGGVCLASWAAAASGKGYDVSWPQCGGKVPLPVDGDVGIVGVNGGKPYEENPCLATQYRWARGASSPPAFYMNTANPGTASRVVDWYGQRSPNPACSRNDEAACAFNYGYNAAAHAFAYALRQTGAAARHSWWLDVETTNSWSADTALNVADILGSIAYLRSQNVPVGVYSTEYQWGRITGGTRLPDVPVWLAGARNADQAARWCGPENSFTGGRVLLVQWVQDDLDHNHLCAPLPTPTGPSSAALEQLLKDLLSLDLGKVLRDLGIPLAGRKR